MSVELEHTHVGGFAAIALTNDVLRVVIVPEIGGKIVSLFSRGTNREWLWSNPHLALRKPPAGASDFGQFDCGGWDEIFPTVNPCRVAESAWGDRMLTDHGELWFRPWRTASTQIEPGKHASLTLVIDDPALPFRFARTLHLSAGAGPLVASYELANRTKQTLPFLWAAHPLLAVQPGDTIQLPAGARISSTGSVGLNLDPDAQPSAWPSMRLQNGETIDLGCVPERSAGIAVKLFAQNVLPGCVAVVDKSTGESIQFSCESPEISHVGLWLNFAAWSGAGTEPYFNVGIEPTTSPQDDLHVAVEHKTAIQLRGGETRSWRLTVTCR